jgi:hypothetical protein
MSCCYIYVLLWYNIRYWKSVVGLCPAVQNTLDEHVLVALKDKFGEKLQVTYVMLLLLCYHMS